MTGMKPMKRFYCRAYQTVFDLGSRVLPWRKPEIVSGAGSTARIPEMLRGCGVKKVMIVSGKHTGAALVPPIRAQIEAAGISAVHFDAVRANPTISIIEQVRERYLKLPPAPYRLASKLLTPSVKAQIKRMLGK